MTFPQLWIQSLRASWRDARSPEVRLLVLALAVAVAALASVGVFVDRAQRALERDAAAFIGGDLALDSDRRIDPAIAAQAAADGLQVARSVTFPSMVLSGPHPERGVLTALKAVSGGYPLRGSLMLRTPQGAAVAAVGGPPPGAAWIDPQLLGSLDVAPNQTIRLGDSSFRVAGLIASEPDRGAQFFSFAPRVMIRLDDLPATDLVQPASRVMYHLQFAGAPQAVARFTGWLTPRVHGGERLQTLGQGRPDLHAALGRARQFLTLAALLAAVLSAVAVATAVRAFSQRRLQDCALLRCLGLPPRDLLWLLGLQFLWIGAAASLAGAAAGSALHVVLVRALAAFLPAALPPVSVLPALQACACGIVLLGGLALAPVVRMHRVTPLRVLRRELKGPGRPAVTVYALAMVSFALLLLWLARDARLAAFTAGGFAAAGVLFAGAAALWLKALQWLRERADRLPTSLSFALAAMGRRPGATVLQMVALSFGLTTLLVMAMIRTDLLRQWRAQIPVDAPNHFIINIQPDQVVAVTQRLEQVGVADPKLYPMVRGRLVAINGQNVDASRYGDERARGLAEREFNLSYMSDAPPANRIVQGHWFAPDAPELSIEQGIADTLGVHLGDRLGFDVAGQIVTARTTSVREVSWDSMKVNFFVIMAPPLLRDQPQTWITAVHIPPQPVDPAAALVHRFRNLTVIDTGALLSQVRSVLDQVSRAVQFVFVFALASGLLVLYAALSASQDERARQAALVRAFGASRRRLWEAQLIELCALGAMAGALAGLAANGIGWLLAHQVLHFEFTLELAPLLIGAALGAVCAAAGGTLALRRVIATPPWVILREA